MFWAGRVNAILFLITVVGFVATLAAYGLMSAGGFIIVMLIVRVFLWLLNVIWAAVTGKPLFYSDKVM